MEIKPYVPEVCGSCAKPESDCFFTRMHFNDTMLCSRKCFSEFVKQWALNRKVNHDDRKQEAYKL